MALVQTITKMLRHEHSIIHDADGDHPVHVSYTPDESPVRYFVVDDEAVRYYSDPRQAAADFIRTVGAQNAGAAARQAQAEARAYAAGE